MPTKHYPFMYCPRTGKGPRNGESVKANKWECSCQKKKQRPNREGSWSLCNCTHLVTGRRRRVWNSLDYKNGTKSKHGKDGYNAEYKAWVKKNRKRICRRPGKEDFPRQGSGLRRPPKLRPAVNLKAVRTRIKVLRRSGH